MSEDVRMLCFALVARGLLVYVLFSFFCFLGGVSDLYYLIAEYKCYGGCFVNLCMA